ncbi:hypothetical protein FOS14_03620 [Skermania sp. ID1734]|uniref:YciI family protein n=1 Tax=Skermania sp. ID1734 TaxID=2597516 RepID=UPI00117D3292|nr:YciI family protein [Skermania sp. ID1734]TSE01627.1 hypothetical protein FOS14_03620 [Skermania sp. ID1734]
MMTITDEFMREMMGKTRPYTVVLLKKTAAIMDPEAQKIIWEHGRRNFALREEGKLVIVCPIRDHEIWSGVGILDADIDEARQIMDGDPGVQAGIFTYELVGTRSFPGDALPQ